jgi:hypothetical protein
MAMGARPTRDCAGGDEEKGRRVADEQAEAEEPSNILVKIGE